MPTTDDDAALRAGGNEYLRWPLVTVLDLEPLPTAATCARAHTRRVLADWQLPRDLIGDAEILVSELMTNAFRASMALHEAVCEKAPREHEPTPIALRLLANHERLVIEAWDCHPGIPVQRSAPLDEEGGRGLAVIEACSHRWGTRRLSRNVKTVWCELLMPRLDPA